MGFLQRLPNDCSGAESLNDCSIVDVFGPGKSKFLLDQRHFESFSSLEINNIYYDDIEENSNFFHPRVLKPNLFNLSIKKFLFLKSAVPSASFYFSGRSSKLSDNMAVHLVERSSIFYTLKRKKFDFFSPTKGDFFSFFLANVTNLITSFSEDFFNFNLFSFRVRKQLLFFFGKELGLRFVTPQLLFSIHASKKYDFLSNFYFHFYLEPNQIKLDLRFGSIKNRVFLKQVLVNNLFLSLRSVGCFFFKNFIFKHYLLLGKAVKLKKFYAFSNNQKKWKVTALGLFKKVLKKSSNELLLYGRKKFYTASHFEPFLPYKITTTKDKDLVSSTLTIPVGGFSQKTFTFSDDSRLSLPLLNNLSLTDGGFFLKLVKFIDSGNSLLPASKSLVVSSPKFNFYFTKRFGNDKNSFARKTSSATSLTKISKVQNLLPSDINSNTEDKDDYRKKRIFLEKFAGDNFFDFASSVDEVEEEESTEDFFDWLGEARARSPFHYLNSEFYRKFVGYFKFSKVLRFKVKKKGTFVYNLARHIIGFKKRSDFSKPEIVNQNNKDNGSEVVVSPKKVLSKKKSRKNLLSYTAVDLDRRNRQQAKKARLLFKIAAAMKKLNAPLNTKKEKRIFKRQMAVLKFNYLAHDSLSMGQSRYYDNIFWIHREVTFNPRISNFIRLPIFLNLLIGRSFKSVGSRGFALSFRKFSKNFFSSPVFFNAFFHIKNTKFGWFLARGFVLKITSILWFFVSKRFKLLRKFSVLDNLGRQELRSKIFIFLNYTSINYFQPFVALSKSTSGLIHRDTIDFQKTESLKLFVVEFLSNLKKLNFERYFFHQKHVFNHVLKLFSIKIILRHYFNWLNLSDFFLSSKFFNFDFSSSYLTENYFLAKYSRRLRFLLSGAIKQRSTFRQRVALANTLKSHRRSFLKRFLICSANLVRRVRHKFFSFSDTEFTLWQRYYLHSTKDKPFLKMVFGSKRSTVGWLLTMRSLQSKKLTQLVPSRANSERKLSFKFKMNFLGWTTRFKNYTYFNSNRSNLFLKFRLKFYNLKSRTNLSTMFFGLPTRELVSPKSGSSTLRETDFSFFVRFFLSLHKKGSLSFVGSSVKATKKHVSFFLKKNFFKLKNFYNFSNFLFRKKFASSNTNYKTNSLIYPSRFSQSRSNFFSLNKKFLKLKMLADDFKLQKLSNLQADLTKRLRRRILVNVNRIKNKDFKKVLNLSGSKRLLFGNIFPNFQTKYLTPVLQLWRKFRRLRNTFTIKILVRKRNFFVNLTKEGYKQTLFTTSGGKGGFSGRTQLSERSANLAGLRLANFFRKKNLGAVTYLSENSLPKIVKDYQEPLPKIKQLVKNQLFFAKGLLARRRLAKQSFFVSFKKRDQVLFKLKFLSSRFKVLLNETTLLLSNRFTFFYGQISNVTVLNRMLIIFLQFFKKKASLFAQHQRSILNSDYSRSVSARSDLFRVLVRLKKRVRHELDQRLYVRLLNRFSILRNFQFKNYLTTYNRNRLDFFKAKTGRLFFYNFSKIARYKNKLSSFKIGKFIKRSKRSLLFSRRRMFFKSSLRKTAQFKLNSLLNQIRFSFSLGEFQKKFFSKAGYRRVYQQIYLQKRLTKLFRNGIKIGRVRLLFKGKRRGRARFITKAISSGLNLKRFAKIKPEEQRCVSFGFSRAPAVRRI